MSTINHAVDTITVQNVDRDRSTISKFEQILAHEQDNCIISDVDEELLIFVKFRQPVILRSMKIYQSPHEDNDVSGPKEIKIYIPNDLNVNFEDVKQITPQKTFICKQKKLNKGQNIKLEFIKKIQKLIIYILSNQKDTECTSINTISFKGKADNQIQISRRQTEITCRQCSLSNIKTISNFAHKNQISKIITQHTLDTDNQNTHCFLWTFDNTLEIQQFLSTEVNDITFRSDYHIIDGFIFYFELTPNGTMDRTKVGAGYTNVWLNLHESIHHKDFVKLRFQCFCINDNMSFIGEKDAILNPTVINKKNDCRSGNVGSRTEAISTDNFMRFSKFKHLTKFSFLCKVTLNPTTFKLYSSVPKTQEETKSNLDEDDIHKKPHVSCDADIKQCNYLARLIKITQVENIDFPLTEILNLFHHLLFKHDDDFEYIMKRIANKCNIGCCIRFSRNYRDRRKENAVRSSINCQDVVRQQLLDTIHCYFGHSIHIGHRFHRAQQKQLDNISSEFKDCDDIKHFSAENFQNHKLQKIRELIQLQYKPSQSEPIKQSDSKPTKQSNQHPILFNLPSFYQRYAKFNQLDPASIVNKTQSNQYSYGQLFFYETNEYGVANVLPKFGSFKDEMLHNTLCTMEAYQFEQLMSKGVVYFDSDYRKSKYNDMILEHILSFLVYCNFDGIQYEFSKTFREYDICRHNQFYHFGFYLYIGVNKYGEDAGTNCKLYHGINAKLSFPDVIGPSIGIKMNSPLSTSLSLPVAVNFSGDKGLIIEFSGSQVKIQGLSANYLAMNWLSDYTSESECLFIGTSGGLYIRNISDMNGNDYGYIIQALCVLQEKIKGGYEILLRVASGDVKIKFLMARIIENQLFKALGDNSKYKAWLDVNTYGQCLIDTFCKGRDTVCVKCSDKHIVYRYFYPDIYAILAMFPNVTHIGLVGVDISEMDRVLRCIFNIWGNKSIISRLETVRIYPKEKSVDIIINSHINKFKQYKYIMKPYDDNKGIILLLNSKIMEPDPSEWAGTNAQVLIKKFTKNVL